MKPTTPETLASTATHTATNPADGLATTRRNLLKGTAAILAAGTFPAIHADDKPVLRYLGTAVNQDKAVKFEADTGIKIQYVAVTTDGEANAPSPSPTAST